MSPYEGSALLARYEALLAHAEHELELAGRADIDGLAALGESWVQLTAGLPETAPREARSLLERAQLISERARIELIRIRDGLLLESAAAVRAKRAAGGYARELTPAPHLDRSA